MRNIFEKFGREDQNPGGVVPTPLGRPKVDFYLGHLRVKLVQNNLHGMTDIDRYTRINKTLIANAQI